MRSPCLAGVALLACLTAAEVTRHEEFGVELNSDVDGFALLALRSRTATNKTSLPTDASDATGEKPTDTDRSASLVQQRGPCTWKAIRGKTYSNLNKGSGAHIGMAKKMWKGRPFTCMSASKKAWCHMGSPPLKAGGKAISYTCAENEAAEGGGKEKEAAEGGDKEKDACDFVAYCNTNPDLAKAFCGGGPCTPAHAAKCERHWKKHGKGEGRTCPAGAEGGDKEGEAAQPTAQPTGEPTAEPTAPPSCSRRRKKGSCATRRRGPRSKKNRRRKKKGKKSKKPKGKKKKGKKGKKGKKNRRRKKKRR